MANNIQADASPEKRLFISLITRDISLADAFLDIIDNSINSALEPLASSLRTANDYQKLLANTRIKPKVQVHLSIGAKRIEVYDTAFGISAEKAKNEVFKFGRAEVKAGSDKKDRLSVYGIGLKRAMFKIGNKIDIISDHRNGGFELNLDVKKWAAEKKQHWTFDIKPRSTTRKQVGTKITISKLHDDVLRRINDGLFVGQLRAQIARTYSFFIGRVVEIFVDQMPVEKELFVIGKNFASRKIESGKVSCNITAGIAVASGEQFQYKNSGWFVFCNGRTVLYSDKTNLTGWGGEGLPIFQPKHRPFLGTVFFVSSDAEALPWTTTKASINQESGIWQEAKRHMTTVGRVITGFLDRRYDNATDVLPSDLQQSSGKGVSVLSAAVSKPQEFIPITRREPVSTRIQYDAKISDVRRIENHLQKPGLGGSGVGRYTFRYFLKNEVGGES